MVGRAGAGSAAAALLVALLAVQASAEEIPALPAGGHLSMASDGSSPPAVAAPPSFLPSWSGRRLAAEAPDALAEGRAGVASPRELLALLRLPTAQGSVGSETIIGPDDRVRITPTTAFPARATVLVTFSTGRCSGWMIGPDTVATAGHCVHTGGPGGEFRRDVVVYPGRNGGLSPYGSCTAKRLYTVDRWVAASDDRYDYGAIKLNCRIGLTTGWYGLYRTSGSLTGEPSTITGYPGDKPLTLWQSVDRIRVTQARRLFYQNDTIGGMSGSPVYNVRPGCGTCAMAVHAYGIYGRPPFSTNNHGTRITQDVYDNYVAWQSAP
jgi:glutamyl endopeptidase